jgi:hypothetical protein
LLTFQRVEHPLLNSNTKELRVLPIGDTHIGDPNFDRFALTNRLDKAMKEDTLVFLTGDILNNGIKSSVSDIYEECIAPGDEQIEYAYELFKPYKSILVGCIDGNHENRTVKDVNISPTKYLAEKLSMPYWGIHSLLKFQLGKNEHGDLINYIFYVHHGSGGGRSRGAKANKMINQEMIVTGADVYVRSHTHSVDVFPNASIEFDARTMRTFIHKMYHVNTGSWLNWSKYAERMEYPVLPIGTPTIILNGTRKEVLILQ